MADPATTVTIGDGLNFLASGGLALLLWNLYGRERAAREAAETRERQTLERIVEFGQSAFPLLADARKDAEDAARRRSLEVGTRVEIADVLDDLRTALDAISNGPRGK